LLCQHFIDQFNKTLGRKITGIAPSAMSGLLQYEWPGNVRELENTIERSIVLADGNLLKSENFSLPVDQRGLSADGRDYDGYSLKTAQRQLEIELIIKALKATEGNRTHAARLLQISHPSLLSKMRMYEIDI
jgi:two-component system response regulator AtoC